ncbi:MAG: hydantoinase/oxoprolinase family protein [Alphaproteobacteria bacterium]|nr:hydantoinase/oxoprolinase family protein [Alphaproteobacteria bacterium]
MTGGQATPTGPRRVRIAVDIGGTFTDLQILDEATGAASEIKTATTPADPTRGLLEGIREGGLRFGFGPGNVGLLLLGTTIATNAILQRRFPPCALVTTAGFEDVLEIGRHMRRDIYGLYAEERIELIPRQHRFGVPERIGAGGRVQVPLDEVAATDLAKSIASIGVPAVAICLLNSFLNPVHERRLGEILRTHLPTLDISLSSEVSPEIREFERTSTTALNALLMPIVREYLARLDGSLQAVGISAPILLVQSNGGVCRPDVAAREPVRLVLSGPSGGTMAAERLAAVLAIPDLVAVDMGGTSFDVSLVQGGHAGIVSGGEINGCPVRLPMVEMRTIGAGGGSIARLTEVGQLRVGPGSAGAEPGPACYGRGGAEPTVTDANLVLGRIDAAAFAGGRMPLDVGAAGRAIEARIAAPLGLSLEAAAEGILAIVNANMAGAIRVSLFERGLDPADHALVAFGGAGGLHAALLAEELGMSRVVFPASASTLSAWGFLWSDLQHHLAQSRIMAADASAVPVLQAMARALAAEGRALLRADGVTEELSEVALAADMRYLGQGYELTVPLPAGTVDAGTINQSVQAFHAAHRQRFLHADEGEPVEFVTLRATARGRLAKPAERPRLETATAPSHRRRPVYIDGAWRETAVHDRSSLALGARITGPALIEEAYTVILLSDGWCLAAGPSGDLLASRP